MQMKEMLKNKDKYCTKFVIEQIKVVKKYFNIPDYKMVYALDWWCDRDYFLCEDKVYAVYFDYIDDDSYKPIVNSAYIITLKNGEIFDFEVIKPDDTTPKFKDFHGIKINRTRKNLTEEHFDLWLDSPCCINEFVDVSYRKVINFLQHYKKTTFKTDKYLFYVKRDNDTTWAYFIYAYDLKNNAKLKIYVDCYIYTKFPEKLTEIYVKDLSGKLSDYQKLQCKKAFFEYCRVECNELNAPNFYALELIKQCIQPIEKDRGWSVDRPFLCGSEFDNIWIDDVLRYDEKPYFLVCNNDQYTMTKIAVLDFYKPEYKSTEPYINAFMKRNHWDMDKETLERLVEFLKEPWKTLKKDCVDNDYRKGVKTNWQRLVSLYNENTADFDENYEELPSNLPMPDYTKIWEKYHGN